jgi:F-type H+-transporting ATPase subunit b
MKFAGFNRKRAIFKKAIMGLLIAICLPVFAGIAFGASGGAEGTKGWVATDTYRIINFVLLVAILFFFLRKPISQALNGRIQGIRDQLQELEDKKADAEKQLAQYNEKLSQLDAEAEKIVEEYIRQGNEAKKRILEEAALAAEKLETQAKKNIAHEFEQAKLKLQEDIMEKALDKAEAVIRTSISTSDQEKLVDEYLKKVVGL